MASAVLVPFLPSSALTYGEALRIQRRRDGNTQAQEAACYGVSAFCYRQWEASDEYVDGGPVKPGVSPTVAETCFLLRRRQGLKIADVARACGVSRAWVVKMERGEAPVDRLAAFWAGRAA